MSTEEDLKEYIAVRDAHFSLLYSSDHFRPQYSPETLSLSAMASRGDRKALSLVPTSTMQ